MTAHILSVVLGILAGAGVGVACQELYTEFKKLIARSSNFRNALNALETKINILTPIVKEMERFNQKLGTDHHKQASVLSLVQRLTEAKHLVSKCTYIRHSSNLFKKKKYEKRLRNMDSSLEQLLIQCSCLHELLTSNELK